MDAEFLIAVEGSSTQIGICLFRLDDGVERNVYHRAIGQ